MFIKMRITLLILPYITLLCTPVCWGDYMEGSGDLEEYIGIDGSGYGRSDDTEGRTVYQSTYDVYDDEDIYYDEEEGSGIGFDDDDIYTDEDVDMAHNFDESPSYEDHDRDIFIHEEERIGGDREAAPPSPPPEAPSTKPPPTLTDTDPKDTNKMDNSVTILTQKGNERQVSVFAQPGILAAFIGGAVVGLLCAILLVMFIVYRMRKKDEGSYPLDEPKRMPLTSASYSPNSKEIYA